MLLQVASGADAGTQPPQGFTVPAWDLLAAQDRKAHEAFTSFGDGTTVTLGPCNLTLGHDDAEGEDDTCLDRSHTFGWDNESPARGVTVLPFRIEWRPVSNGKFHTFWLSEEGKSSVKFPSTWTQIGDQIYVRTLYGPVPLEEAFHWPVITSYDDLSTYARVQGGRLPTEPELRLFLDTFCSGYLGGANIGFRRWHPMASVVFPSSLGLILILYLDRATTGGSASGSGHNGGIWEWTSTVFEAHEKFVPSELYPG